VTIFMVGVNHFDPLGRADLLARLNALAASHPDPPAFVALEFDRHHFSDLVAQRPYFRKVLQGASPDLGDGELDVLVSSLAYEGDTHREVFPTAPVLWLDEGRVLSDGDLRDYADQRARMYIGHAGGSLHGASDKISRSIKTIAGTDINRGRSQAFAARIEQQLHDPKGTWAVVITGESHASASVAGSMRQLLQAAGVTCAQG